MDGMIWVDPNECIGCGLCVTLCPEGFEIKEGKSIVKNSDADCVSDAMADCPVGAIATDNKDNMRVYNQPGISSTGQRIERGVGNRMVGVLDTVPKSGRGRRRSRRRERWKL